MKNRRRTAAAGCIALVILVSAPLPSRAIAQGEWDYLGDLAGGSSSGGGFGFGDILGIFSGGSGSGFNLGGILGGLVNIGQVFGLQMPDIGNLSALGSLGTGQPWDDSIPGGVYGDNGALGGFNQGDIQKATQVAEGLSGLYSAASSGNINGIFKSLTGLAGVFGLVDPQSGSNVISGQGILSGGQGGQGSNTDLPAMKDAETPSHAYFLSQVGASEYRSLVGNIAQITLGPQGQEILKDQAIESALALTLSRSAQQATNSTIEKSVEATQASIQGAESSVKEAEEAQKAKDSQSVLKAMSKQQALAAQQDAIISGQLSIIATNQAQIGSQLLAQQAQSKIHSDQLHVLEVNSAAQLRAGVQIANIVDRQLQYQQGRDQQDVAGGAQSMSYVYVPGFAPKN